MKYLQFTYVGEHQFPAVEGLQFVWARESEYPTEVPKFFGTCPDTSATNVEGVIGEFNQYDFDNMQAEEMRARPQPKASAIAALLAEKGVTRQVSQLTILVLENEAKAQAPAYAMTPEQGVAYLYTRNKTYRECKDLEAAIVAIEVAP